MKFFFQNIRKKEYFQHRKHDEQLDQYDNPQFTAVLRKVTESVVVEIPNFSQHTGIDFLLQVTTNYRPNYRFTYDEIL